MELKPLGVLKPVTVNLNNRLSVRLYRDCRPNCLETAPLQKGLVLMLDGEELIDEGVGFGVPVIKYEDKTYFSSSAVSIQEASAADCIVKKYSLDTISKKRWRNHYLNDNFYSLFRKSFERFYLKNKKLSPAFNKLMEFRDFAKIKTEFEKVKPRGNVTVSYRCQPTKIHVNADFSDLNLHGCKEILVLNEQGSTFFNKYSDSNGLELAGNKIGAWDVVAAHEASLQNLTGQAAFSLQAAGGARLFRGWERTKNRFSWAGLSYSLPPNNGVFRYTIELGQ